MEEEVIMRWKWSETRYPGNKLSVSGGCEAAVIDRTGYVGVI